MLKAARGSPRHAPLTLSLLLCQCSQPLLCTLLLFIKLGGHVRKPPKLFLLIFISDFYSISAFCLLVISVCVCVWVFKLMTTVDKNNQTPTVSTTLRCWNANCSRESQISSFSPACSLNLDPPL